MKSTIGSPKNNWKRRRHELPNFRREKAASRFSAFELAVNPEIELISPSNKSRQFSLSRRSRRTVIE